MPIPIQRLDVRRFVSSNMHTLHLLETPRFFSQVD